MKNITTQSIALKYRKALVLETSDVSSLPTPQSITLAMELLHLGFVMKKELSTALNSCSDEQLAAARSQLIDGLREMKGADVTYTPMYPNFPQQVAEANDIELFLNAIVHYWTFGAWSPEYEVLPREYAKETDKLVEIGVIEPDELNKIFNQIVTSNESISEGDKEVVTWFLDNQEISISGEIPFKENMCFLAGELLKRGVNVAGVAKTATDVLRIITSLNDGDISLAEDTKFKSLPRSQRKMFAEILDDVASEEDINRYRGKWTVLFHNLHIGDYSDRLYKIAKKIRNNEKIATFNSRVQSYIDTGDQSAALEALKARPGEFARRLDTLLRKFPEKTNVTCRAFKGVVDQMNTRTLLQLFGHMKTRFEDTDKRVAFPKGSVQKALLLPGQVALDGNTVLKIQSSIRTELVNRFGKLESLGNVWIDPELRYCPIPTQQRSASEGLFQVARGTRLPLGDDKTTLRFFIYWKGRDIDLSATLHDENFKNIGHCGYTQLRSAKFQTYHSGDIVNAPKGASEFIDITINGAVESGARYVAMNVLSFSQIPFDKIEICYAGWMTRTTPQSNEIYDPKTVQQKIDVRGDSTRVIPVIFDLVERKAIWADLASIGRDDYYGYGAPNNVENNRASIEQATEAMLNINNKVSLLELFTIHALGRGELVKTREEADTVFSLYDGTVSAGDISIINSEFII